MKRMDKNKIIFILSICIIIFIGLIPHILWKKAPSSKLNIWILDKTVPYEDYREHKGFVWVLDYIKIFKEETNTSFDYKKDYYGFFPKKEGYDIKSITEAEGEPDLIYLADTYGVYEEDFKRKNIQGTRSEMIYGGFKSDELIKVKSSLKNGTTLIGEFNTLASPTNPSTRKDLELLFGMKWEKWIGRYFSDLTKDVEVPVWAVSNYEKQYNKSWNFKGPGFLLVSSDDRVIVLEKEKDVGKRNIRISYNEPYDEEFNISKDIEYYYWFEFLKPDANSEVLANFKLDLTTDGIRKLKEYGLEKEFPAVIRRKNQSYTTYYFGGDFVDNNEIPKHYRFWGYDLFRKLLTSKEEGQPDEFYWKVYVPMMKNILKDAKNNSLKFISDFQPEYFHEDNINMISKIQDMKLKVYKKGNWEELFIKGVNMGMAVPGKWFTEMPEDETTYLRWLQMIGNMNANAVRIYTLNKPAFYSALKTYNVNNPEKPIYLIQEIWPDESPKNSNYLDKEYLDGFKREIEYAIDAVHGVASIPERRGKSYGNYYADVSPYTIAYLVGRELEPEEVIETNKLNKGFTYEGKYISNKSSNPTEAWLALSCDYVLDYEMKNYSWQHPVAIVSWPTLDPLAHDSEWNINGDKSKEYNDKTIIDINNFEVEDKNKAGFLGAYHIYPNYPDFMNNEKHYDEYKDGEGRFRYGGYLKEFMEGHKKYPALVAEFGIATGMANAHTSPDGYNHGGLTEEEQGKGIIRMMSAIKKEGYMGGVIFEWIDEWAKKTWITEPFMIPYERQVIWHNGIDPEQNYGLLAMESIEPKESEKTVLGSGTLREVEFKTNETYLYINLKLKDKVNLQTNELIIGLDTYDRVRGEYKYNTELDIEAPSGMEFILSFTNNKGKILANTSYNIGNLKFASKKSNSGIFTEINPIINKARVRRDGSKTEEIRQDGSNLIYGDFSETHSHWYMEGDTMHIRIPWGRLNVTDPSSLTVLDDEREFSYYPSRDIFKTRKTEGIVLTAVYIEDKKLTDIFPGESKFNVEEFKWKTWEIPTYKERLKKSYKLIQEYFKSIH